MAVAALLLVGAAGCGGSSDAGGGSDGSAKTTQGSNSDKGGGTDESGDDGEQAKKDLPDPCDLVPIEKASEILGGESAQPESTASDAGLSMRTCVWQTQEGKDNPTLDGAGHILTLNVMSPPEGMSMSDYWDAGKTSDGAEETAVTDCSAGFWLGGMLSATTDGVYLTGSAGLNDSSEDAKQSVMQLVSTACGSL
jgi:hypothetical protein